MIRTLTSVMRIPTLLNNVNNTSKAITIPLYHFCNRRGVVSISWVFGGTRHFSGSKSHHFRFPARRLCRLWHWLVIRSDFRFAGYCGVLIRATSQLLARNKPSHRHVCLPKFNASYQLPNHSVLAHV